MKFGLIFLVIQFKKTMDGGYWMFRCMFITHLAISFSILFPLSYRDLVR